MKFLLDRSWLWLASLFIISAAACAPVRIPSISPTINITQAYQTVEAKLTQSGAGSLATATPEALAPTLTAIPQNLPDTPQPTPLPASVTPSLPPPTPSPSATSACDYAAAGNPIDVTIPDDTQMNAGQGFTKIWRLQNVGVCTWTKAYSVRFFYGDRMEAAERIFLNQEIRPGEAIEIAVDMIAPEAPGSYQGNWKLSNAEDRLFGIGPKGDAPFWVRIVVVRPPTATPTPSGTPTHTPTPSATSQPTETATPTRAVQSQGSITLAPSQAINLDTGQSDGGDLIYLIENNFHLLVPQANALLGVYGNTEPGFLACQSATMGTASLALESLSQGMYLCYRTDQGLAGWLRYVSLSPNDETIVLDFRTWAGP
jgi:hypothetical protein